MQLRKLLLCLLLVILASFLTVSSVYAVKITITQVQNPDTVTYGSSDIIHVRARVIAGGFTYQSPNTGLFGVLATWLEDSDNGGSVLYGADVIVSSDPDACNQADLNGTIGPPATDCRFAVPHPGITETVDFAFASSHAPRLPLWHLQIVAMGFGYSASLTSIVTSSANYNLTISVEIQSSQTTSRQTASLYTSPVTSLSSTIVETSSLQMPQPPQSTTSQPTNKTLQLATLAVVAAAVLGALFLYSRRKEQAKITKAEKVDIDAGRLSTKTAEGKRFCIECGNELPQSSSSTYPTTLYCTPAKFARKLCEDDTEKHQS
jgi:hypothetical protein